MVLSSITPLLLTHNEEPNIGRALDRLSWAARILLVDSGSTDATLEIASRFPQVEVLQRPFDSFAEQCNFGLKHIRSDWVLSLDADYLCSAELVSEIEALPNDPETRGYGASFRYFIGGRTLRRSLYPPRTILYRREHARYEDDGHAHRVVIDGTVGSLKSPIYHDDRKPLSRWLESQDRYARREVEKLLSTPRRDLNRIDRLRRRGWIVPLIMPAYCLLAKGLIFDGSAGFYYTFQRTYAEVLLALRLLQSDSHSFEMRPKPMPSDVATR